MPSTTVSSLRPALALFVAATAACYQRPASRDAGTAADGASSTSIDHDGASSSAGASSTTDGSGAPEPSTCSDDADCDDHSACSDDRCEAGACAHVPNDAPGCTCDDVADCDVLPPSDDCGTRRCVDGTCRFDLTDAGVAVNPSLQTTGDCHRVVCDGLGAATDELDPADPPIDGLECTEDRCEAGVGTNPPLDATHPCAAGTCDGDGACVGCEDAADCGDAASPCLEVTCVDGTCGVVPRPEGTVLPAALQTEGDCVELRCDGRGSTFALAVDDPPPDDGSGCSTVACEAGTAVVSWAAADLPCDDGVCDGSGSCVACNTAAHCPPAAAACMVATCTAHACGVDMADAGVTCNDGLYCTLHDACDGSGSCIGSGSPCPGADGDNNCNESCNEATDSCNAHDPVDSPCNDAAFCTAVDRCNAAGICVGTGSPCPGPDGDADCTESCNEAADACNAADPAGSDCGGECNTCGGGVCHVYEPNQCP